MGPQNCLTSLGLLLGGAYLVVWVQFLQEVSITSMPRPGISQPPPAATTRGPSRPAYVYTTWIHSRLSQEVPVVLVTSYMHAGSSILGSVFMKRRAAVYFYEPLDAIYASVFNMARYLWPTAYTNGPDTAFRERTRSEKEMIGYYLDAMLSCNISALPELLTEHLYISGDASCVLKCNVTSSYDVSMAFRADELLNNRTLRHTSCTDVTAMPDSCDVRRLTSACVTSPLVALKLLRYDLGDLETRLNLHSNLYVMHELRDPRGVIQSYVRSGVGDVTLGILTKELCNVIAHDLVIVEGLLRRYPKRVTVIRYEDFAHSPVEVTSQMYRFVNRPLPPEVVRWLRETTQSRTDSGKYRRHNASATANKWRRSMTFKHRTMVAEVCTHVAPHLHMFGYDLATVNAVLKDELIKM